MKIIKATKKELDILTPLFDGYRVFYNQKSDQTRAHDFLTNRLSNNDSVIFLAVDTKNKGIGFTQLYPSFSSVSTQRTYILNDLFVASNFRNKGVGEALMEHAKQFAIQDGAKGITLETNVDNPAQYLYERLHWKKDTDVYHYTWETPQTK